MTTLSLAGYTRSPRRGPGCISAWGNVTVPAIKDFHDARKQGGGNDGVTLLREMDQIQGTILQRHHLVVHNHADRASLEPALHLGNIRRTPRRGDEETPIVATRLQDHDVGSVR